MIFFPPEHFYWMRRGGIGFFRRFSLTVVLVTIAATPAFAGRFEIEKGDGVEVCEVYANNLNTSNTNLMTLACPRPVNPAFDDLRKPEWKRLLGNAPIPPGINLVSKVDRFLWERDANPIYYFSRSKWRNTEEQRNAARKNFETQRNARLAPGGPSYAEVDIDNDGIAEPVYYESGCGTSFGSLILVLNKDYSDIDYAKTELVMVHPSRKEEKLGEIRPVKKGDQGIPPGDMKAGFTPVGDSLHEAFYDVFFFKNKTYLDLWGYAEFGFHSRFNRDVGRLRVYTIHNHQRREVCSYRYTDNN